MRRRPVQGKHHIYLFLFITLAYILRIRRQF